MQNPDETQIKTVMHKQQFEGKKDNAGKINILTDSRPAKEYSTNPMCYLAATSGDICGEFKSANIQNDSTAETKENRHTPRVK